MSKRRSVRFGTLSADPVDGMDAILRQLAATNPADSSQYGAALQQRQTPGVG